MENNQQASVLISMQGVKVFRIVDKMSTQVCEGEMRIGCISTQNVYFLNVQDFYYTLQKQINFTVIEFETQRTFIFPHIESGFSAVVIPTGLAGNQELDTIMRTTVTVLTAQQAKTNQQLAQNIDFHAPEIWTKPLVEESQAIYYIQKSGGFLKTGFSLLGGAIAKGINAGGQWLDTKVDKAEQPQEVSSGTKDKVDTVKTKTKQSMQVAGHYLNKIFTPVGQYTQKVIEDVSTKIDNSDNQALKKAKEVTKATSQSINTAFGGLTEGATQVGGAIQNNTTNLVNKKYGEDYSKTFLGATDEQIQQSQNSNPNSL